MIVILKTLLLIVTIDDKHLKDYEKGLEVVRKCIINSDNTKLQSIKFEATTEDYINKITDVTKYFNNLKVEINPKEKYNVQRDAYSPVKLKEQAIECISSCFDTKYFSELKPCYIKEEDFSTAEYYDNRIGRVIINIQVYYYDIHRISKATIIEDINNLKKKMLEILLKSFKEEYLKTLF